MCRYELTIIGSGGGDQPHHPKVLGEAWDHTAVEQTNPDMSRMMETCVGVTWMKYCSQLLRLTGDASAADRIETYLYNGLLGAMKPTSVRMQPTIAPYRWWPTPAGWWPSRRSLRCCPAAAWSLRCPPPMAPSV